MKTKAAATPVKLQPPPGAPTLSGPGVTYIGDAAHIGDPGTAGGSGDPPGSAHPLNYTVTAANTRMIPSTGKLAAQLRIRVRNESTTAPLGEVRVALGPIQSGGAVSVFGLAPPRPLKPGRSGWVEASFDLTPVKGPAVWVLLPPLPPSPVP